MQFKAEPDATKVEAGRVAWVVLGVSSVENDSKVVYQRHR